MWHQTNLFLYVDILWLHNIIHIHYSFSSNVKMKTRTILCITTLLNSYLTRVSISTNDNCETCMFYPLAFVWVQYIIQKSITINFYRYFILLSIMIVCFLLLLSHLPKYREREGD